MAVADRGSKSRFDDACSPEDRLEENLAATQIDITAADLALIEDTVSRIAVQGDRCPKSLQDRVGR